MLFKSLDKTIGHILNVLKCKLLGVNAGYKKINLVIYFNVHLRQNQIKQWFHIHLFAHLRLILLK